MWRSKLASTILAGTIAATSCTSTRAESHRSSSAKNHFKAVNPCPANGNTRGACPGYIIDHIMPLDCGGPDDPSNMQWQTRSEAKAKDRWERTGCHGADRQLPYQAVPIVTGPAVPVPLVKDRTIVKWTDAQGRVHYSDRPQP